MLAKVFRAQVRRPKLSKGDWIEIVSKDLDDFKINLSFDEINKISKDMFKKKVIEACKKYTLRNLLLKQEKRREKSKESKGNKLEYNKLELQNYFKSNQINLKEAKILFKIRTNMLEVKKNYKIKYSKDKHDPNDTPDDYLCPLGDPHVDNEENILKCEKLEINNDSEVQFSDLFSNNEDKVAKTLKIFYKKWKIRQDKLKEE